jgi:hypothetical protein
MRCEHIKDKFPDFLVGELDQKSAEEIRSHIVECSSCRAELENMSALWTKLGVLPEERPSQALRGRFYDMLAQYKEKAEQEKPTRSISQVWNSWFGGFWRRRPAFQLAVSILLVFVGFFTGYFIRSGGENTKLRREMLGIQQMLIVSLMDQPSSIQRLKGINLSSRLEEPNTKTIEALLNTLDSDPNVNVRLAAVDALYLFYDNPLVRERIVSSLSRQTSPLVQVALVDLLVNMKERQAIESFKKLVQDEKLNPDVKQKMEQGIQELSF